MTALLARWTEKLAGGPQAGTSDSPTRKGHGSGVDNNNSKVSRSLGVYNIRILTMARVARSFLIRSFSESLIGCGRSSNTIFFSDL